MLDLKRASPIAHAFGPCHTDETRGLFVNMFVFICIGFFRYRPVLVLPMNGGAPCAAVVESRPCALSAACTSCSDGRVGGLESDIDCGFASGCGLCAQGMRCVSAQDCAPGAQCSTSNVCIGELLTCCSLQLLCAGDRIMFFMFFIAAMELLDTQASVPYVRTSISFEGATKADFANNADALTALANSLSAHVNSVTARSTTNFANLTSSSVVLLGYDESLTNGRLRLLVCGTVVCTIMELHSTSCRVSQTLVSTVTVSLALLVPALLPPGVIVQALR